MAGMNVKDTGVKQNTEMQAIGLNFERWQDAVEAAIASDRLAVTGEVRGGQLIQSPIHRARSSISSRWSLLLPTSASMP